MDEVKSAYATPQFVGIIKDNIFEVFADKPIKEPSIQKLTNLVVEIAAIK